MSELQIGVTDAAGDPPPTRVSIRVRPGQASAAAYGSGRWCYWIRALDRRGNLSGWTGPTCTTIDYGGPSSELPSYPVNHALKAGNALATESFDFSSHDDQSGFLRYEVRTRRSTQTAYQGGWSSPAVVPRGATNASVRAGYRICFQGRGVDKVEQAGPWTEVRCTSAPYDDSVLRFGGPTKVYKASGANGGTGRTMSGSSSFSISSPSSLNCVAIRLLGRAPGENQGVLEGLVDGKVRARWYDGYVTHGWAIKAPGSGELCGRGTLVVRHKAGTPPVTVDFAGLRREHDAGYEVFR